MVHLDESSNFVNTLVGVQAHLISADQAACNASCTLGGGCHRLFLMLFFSSSLQVILLLLAMLGATETVSAHDAELTWRLQVTTRASQQWHQR